MSFNLIPSQFCLYVKKLTKLNCFLTLFFLVLVVLLETLGFFRDIVSFLTFVFIDTVLFVVTIFPIVLCSRKMKSKVIFLCDKIDVIDRKGRRWREISYDAITSFQVEQIADFFYGKRRETFVGTYICFFINGNKEIPNEEYNKLFLNPDFFMMSYSKEALACFQNQYYLHKTGDSSTL